MEGFLRKITIYLCKPIYSLIVYMYKIFYNIATTRFLDTDTVQTLSANIYTLISVVMLFAFSITILSAIVNPDLLNDGKKGVKAAFKRAIIGLILIIIVPVGFDKLYEIQETVMTNSLIEKIVVGISYDCKNNTTDKDCAGGNGGQVIVGTLISSVLYPDEQYADQDGNVEVNVSVAEYYRKMISEDFVKYIGPVAKNINATATNAQNVDVTDDDAYAFKFDKLVALGAGIAMVYILILFSIDVSVRVFKLAFLELTAPISIVSYIAAGDKILASWFKELGKTYAELFIRVAAMAFYLFLIHNLDSAMKNFSNSDWSLVLKAFLLVGMLIFAKQVPDMIGRIFGVEIKSQGGIAGRLGSMAGIGNVAKGAWNGLKKVAGIAGLGAGLIAAPAALPIAAGVGAVAGVGLHGWNKGFGSKEAWKDRTPGRIAKTAGAFFRGKNGIAGTMDAYKAWNDDEAIKSKKYEKDQTRIKKLKDSAKEQAQSMANTVTGNAVYDANGNLDKSVAKNADFKKIAEEGGFNSFATNRLEEYDSKRHTKRVAEKSQASYNSISELISNSISASSSTVDKSKLLSLQSDFENGKVDTKKLMSQLQNSNIDSLMNSSGGLNSTALSIVSYAQNLDNGKGITMSKQEISDNLDEATIRFANSEKDFNDMVDKMSEKDKVKIKAYAKVGDDISKSKV